MSNISVTTEADYTIIKERDGEFISLSLVIFPAQLVWLFDLIFNINLFILLGATIGLGAGLAYLYRIYSYYMIRVGSNSIEFSKHRLGITWVKKNLEYDNFLDRSPIQLRNNKQEIVAKIHCDREHLDEVEIEINDKFWPFESQDLYLELLNALKKHRG